MKIATFNPTGRYIQFNAACIVFFRRYNQVILEYVADENAVYITLVNGKGAQITMPNIACNIRTVCCQRFCIVNDLTCTRGKKYEVIQVDYNVLKLNLNEELKS